jgi:DNA-binding GntR family transcriptional regulator
MAEFRRPQTAQAAVLAELRRRILSGALAPGSPLRQEDLAAALEVSRVPVREALRMLESEGLVSYEPHRGYRAVELHLADLEEIYHLRAVIEDDLARQAVKGQTAGDLERVRRLHRELAVLESGQVTDGPALAEANRAFHFAVLRPGPRALRILQTLWDSSDAYRARWFADAANVRSGAREHAELLAAVEAGQADRAVQILDRHRAAAIDRLREVLPD